MVSICFAGGLIRTNGGFVCVYPDPPLVIVIPVTTPPLIVAVAVAVVVPTPTLTSGIVEYPTPPVLREIEVIVPAVETIAVADAPTVSSGLTNVILLSNLL